MGSSASVNAETIIAEEASSTGTLPFPKDGVKLSFASEFIEMCGGKEKFVGLTTNDVCTKFIKPPTEKFKSSYCEFLRAQNHPAVDTATVFISHAWKYQFLDVLDAIKDHFKGSDDVVIWFDMFSNNQHKAVDLNFDWWCNTFKSAIQQFGHTVMVIAPWSDPITLTRAWCLFEIYCTIDTKSKFDIALSDSEREEFFKDMQDNGTEAIEKMLGAIDAEQSDCFHPEDKARIFEVVRKTVGFKGINSLIFSALRQFLLRKAEERYDKEESAKLKIQYGLILGKLYTAEGKLINAGPILSSTFHCSKAFFGEEHPTTFAAETNLAIYYQTVDNCSLAEQLLQSCLDKKIKVFGEDSPVTLSAMDDLACIYGDLKHYEKAEKLFNRCLELRTAKHGTNHPDTLATMCNLTGLYFNMGEYDKGEKIGTQSVEISTTLLGEDHPDTLIAMNNLATIHDAKKAYDEAERLYKLVKNQRLTSLGSSHPLYLDSLFNLGVHYHSRGVLGKSKKYLKLCVEGRLDVFGPTNEETIDALNYLKNVENAHFAMTSKTEEVEEDN